MTVSYSQDFRGYVSSGDNAAFFSGGMVRLPTTPNADSYQQFELEHTFGVYNVYLQTRAETTVTTQNGYNEVKVISVPYGESQSWGILIQSGNLHLRRRVNSGNLDVVVGTYDPVAHRCLSVFVSNTGGPGGLGEGKLFTSPSGISGTWTLGATAENLSTIHFAEGGKVVIGCGYYGGTAPSTVRKLAVQFIQQSTANDTVPAEIGS